MAGKLASVALASLNLSASTVSVPELASRYSPLLILAAAVNTAPAVTIFVDAGRVAVADAESVPELACSVMPLTSFCAVAVSVALALVVEPPVRTLDPVVVTVALTDKDAVASTMPDT